MSIVRADVTRLGRRELVSGWGAVRAKALRLAWRSKHAEGGGAAGCRASLRARRPAGL
jgi:hypothetical protein